MVRHNRREFLCSGAAFAAGLPTIAAGVEQAAKSNSLEGFNPLKVKRIRIAVGAERPFRRE